MDDAYGEIVGFVLDNGVSMSGNRIAQGHARRRGTELAVGAVLVAALALSSCAAPAVDLTSESPPTASTQPITVPTPTATVTVTTTSAPTNDVDVAGEASLEPATTWPGTVLSVSQRSTKRRDVQQVQTRLNELGYGPLAADGHFGPLLSSAVQAFQGDQALPTDGLVGQETWARLFDDSAPLAQPSASAAVDGVSTRIIRCVFSVPDINGALVTQVGGYPGRPLTELSGPALDKLGRLLESLNQGATYPCPGGSGGGYNDIVEGTSVLVEDGDGTALATSHLTGGRVTLHGCTFTYSVEVPEADFYAITISHRGTLTYSHQDLEASGWRVSTKL